ncbi:MAG TPA: 4Fe-4S ferredoxin [Armatimonadetes bacterium]|nr:4Fe-4S ferredoxin [Armatimonadota bacterium]
MCVVCNERSSLAIAIHNNECSAGHSNAPNCMSVWVISQDKMGQWVGAMKSANMRVVAPVEEDEMFVFREIDTPDEIRWDYTQSRWAPKEFLFPRTEPLFCFRFNGDDVQLIDVESDARETVLLAVRPCDAAGFDALAKVFLTDYEDPFFATRREHTIIVALACTQPMPTCFCTAVGLSPASTDGVDLLLCPVDGRYLLRAITEKGERLIQIASELFEPADDAVQARAQEVQAHAEAQLPPRGKLENIADVLMNKFESELWEELSRRCLSCGACTYVCPSCSCFDVADEGNVWGGCRYRNWDSCGFAMFTLHASGHNPRPTQMHRCRQRVMHKFSYFPARFGRNMCVGCGRCIQVCPVGMDIYQIAEAMSAVS